MKVVSIGGYHNSVSKKLYPSKGNCCYTPKKQDNISSNYYYTNSPYKTSYKCLNQKISFLGRTVHLLDGGNHAKNMEHFANAVSSDMDTCLHKVEVNSKEPNVKQLKSLEQQLYSLNKNENIEGQYVAITALASVPLLNLQDQYNTIMEENKKFVPENIKANKENLLNFLQKIYNNPEKYRKQIGYMDEIDQGIEYTYGVIREINKLIDKGAKVYIPSGHPQDSTLKHEAERLGYKPELYHFIATGNDVGGKIKALHENIKNKNWYDFNLLSLSNANIVGVKNAKGAQDYMFAAYDSCITDGARGVYNFSPVRYNNKIIGYSYTDTYTNEYPFEEFPANDEVENIAKFVGRSFLDVVADSKDIDKIKKCLKCGLSTSECADKLYPVKDVFTQEQIKKEKIELQGDYVDRSLKLFFRKNSSGKIIFPKCDCEGSGKPSVLSMWGSCFSVLNTIARDIKLEENPKLEKYLSELSDLIDKGKKAYLMGDAEMYFNAAIKLQQGYSLKNKISERDYEPHYLLGLLHIKQKNFTHASSCINNAIDIAAQYVYSLSKPDFKYSNNLVNTIATMYDKLAYICEEKNEQYPAKVCRAAAWDIQNRTSRGLEVIKRRVEKTQYIGDLYNEIKPY